MRFMNWLRSLRKEKPVVQPTPFKGVDMTPDRRGVLPERVQVPLKTVPDPGESLRLARRPSQAQAEQMRRDALADQERIKDMRARHREREDEAYLRRIQQLNYSTYYKRSRAIGSNSAKDNDDDNTVGGAIAGVAVGLAMVDMITNAGSANACTGRP